MRSLLVESLRENGVIVIDDAEVRRAAMETLGRSTVRDDDYPRVAQALDVVAFVSGRVSRARRQWSLRVVVHNAADGMRIGVAGWSGRTVASLRAVRRTGHARVAEHLALAQPAIPPPEVQATVPDPDAPPWYRREDDEPPPSTPEAPPPGAPDPRRDRGYAGLRISVLGGTLRRSMRTEVLVDSTFRPPFEGGGRLAEERQYQSAGIGHMELGFSLELFPDAFTSDPSVPWLGLVLQYRHSLLLDSQGPSCLIAQEPPPSNFGDPDAARGARCPDRDVVPVRTRQQELYAGIRAEPNVGDDIRGPWLTFDAGYGLFQFVLDPRDLALLDRTTIVPPFDYRHIQLGAGIRYGLHPLLFLGARFSYRIGLGVGQDARRIWGMDTGPASGFTVGGELRHEMPYIGKGVFAALGVEWFRFTTSFRGQSSCIVAECAEYELWEPWPERDGVVDGGIRDPVRDEYLRLSLTLGYAYR
ncbi:MAG: hypothetical protein KF901_18325 [Myxococcales bacterium]|nr:hypothetical protein [Myxococcales bacterium]